VERLVVFGGRPDILQVNLGAPDGPAPALRLHNSSFGFNASLPAVSPFTDLHYAFRKPVPTLGGLNYLSIDVPILIAFVLASLALIGMTTPLATYREQGVLRRLSTTPLPPAWVLAAQLVINLVIAAAALVLIVTVGVAAFGVHMPKQAPGFILLVVLAAAALFGIGLWVAAVARTAQAAGAIGNLLLFPMMFFADLWIPQNLMPALLRNISGFTLLGAAVQALQSSMQGSFPSARALLVLAVYAAAFWLLAVKLFKWE
jgi:ABC-2 type transport system permease protein